MLYNSGLPDYFLQAFAASGLKNTIPSASQTGTDVGKASLADGFPSATLIPKASGGVPPYGKDFNGILHWLSLALQRLQAGGIMPYNADFATAIGGYPKGALVRKSAGTGYWQCTADSNATDPDGGSSANWSNVPLLADFGSSLSTSGYQKLPSGLIIQWGAVGPVTGGVAASVTLPITYPNAHITLIASSQSTNSFGGGNSSDLSSGFVFSNNTGAYVNWLSIGY